MNELTEETISLLNDLIQICKDGEQGFKMAADGLKDFRTKNLFSRYSGERATMAAELQQEVEMLGGDAENSGDVKGALHRGWINIKSVVTGKDDAAIIAEAERGEDTAKGAYENALKKELPSNIRALLARQYNQVKAAHDSVSALEIATSHR